MKIQCSPVHFYTNRGTPSELSVRFDLIRCMSVRISKFEGGRKETRSVGGAIDE